MSNVLKAIATTTTDQSFNLLRHPFHSTTNQFDILENICQLIWQSRLCCGQNFIRGKQWSERLKLYKLAARFNDFQSKIQNRIHSRNLWTYSNLIKPNLHESPDWLSLSTSVPRKKRFLCQAEEPLEMVLFSDQHWKSQSLEKVRKEGSSHSSLVFLNEGGLCMGYVFGIIKVRVL